MQIYQSTHVCTRVFYMSNAITASISIIRSAEKREKEREREWKNYWLNICRICEKKRCILMKGVHTCYILRIECTCIYKLSLFFPPKKKLLFFLFFIFHVFVSDDWLLKRRASLVICEQFFAFFFFFALTHFQVWLLASFLLTAFCMPSSTALHCSGASTRVFFILTDIMHFFFLRNVSFFFPLSPLSFFYFFVFTHLVLFHWNKLYFWTWKISDKIWISR